MGTMARRLGFFVCFFPAVLWTMIFISGLHSLGDGRELASGFCLKLKMDPEEESPAPTLTSEAGVGPPGPVSAVCVCV